MLGPWLPVSRSTLRGAPAVSMPALHLLYHVVNERLVKGRSITFTPTWRSPTGAPPCATGTSLPCATGGEPGKQTRQRVAWHIGRNEAPGARPHPGLASSRLRSMPWEIAPRRVGRPCRSGRLLVPDLDSNRKYRETRTQSWSPTSTPRELPEVSKWLRAPVCLFGQLCRDDPAHLS